ncbi:S-methyl-5'-thioadenosine phosphorylase [Rhabdaerophilum sp. SD176]|uniref:S-methyl-5'-thioadenosine phosphorylase n=1 Tax=Rhabdaerophilum sp. SD176 TaxID=2983548 RepID=UPI0024E01D3C|nr:S-methyl-5'-thioadenosine phosphorylase [Rhabdaerophilum sp. SD176]
MKARLGVIGGSGLYDLPGLEDRREEMVQTPWGQPSAALRFGRIGTTELVFLPRHGEGHRLSPDGINYRANIDALKRVGVTDIVSFSAVGSYKEDLAPGVFVVPDQLVDRTFSRESSFFGNGCVAHVAFGDPFGPRLSRRVAEAARRAGITIREGGTAVCMEGPQFSTRAESLFYKGLGYDIIGMTSMPEAKLAREAEITYSMCAMVTDFDCWHPDHANVSVELVIHQVHENTLAARRVLAELAADFPAEREECPVGSHRALDFAIITAPEARDPVLVAKLDAVAGRVLR